MSWDGTWPPPDDTTPKEVFEYLHARLAAVEEILRRMPEYWK